MAMMYGGWSVPYPTKLAETTRPPAQGKNAEPEKNATLYPMG